MKKITRISFKVIHSQNNIEELIIGCNLIRYILKSKEKNINWTIYDDSIRYKNKYYEIESFMLKNKRECLNLQEDNYTMKIDITYNQGTVSEMYDEKYLSLIGLESISQILNKFIPDDFDKPKCLELKDKQIALAQARNRELQIQKDFLLTDPQNAEDLKEVL